VAAAKRAAVAGVAEVNDDAKGMDKNLDLDCAGNRRAAGGLRKARLPGLYRVAEIDRCGRGKKALWIIVVNPPVPVLAQLLQPNAAGLIYVSNPDGLRTR
jgi:hypothetical protein